MINLRYHIVSITAVFLALGIGTALGGTFLDRYTVDVLDRNIRNAETRIRDTEQDNARLNESLTEAEERNDALTQNGSAALFEEMLDGVPVLVVTSQGVDADVVANVRQSLVRADADVRGTLELRDDLDLRDEIDETVAEAVEQDPSDPDAVRAAVYTGLREALFAAGQPPEPEPEADDEPNVPGGEGTPTTAPDGTPIDPAATTTVVPTTTAPPATTAPPTQGEVPDDTTTTTTPSDGPGETDDEVLDGTQPDIVTTLLDRDLLRLTPGPGRSADDPILEQTGYRYVFVGDPELDPVAPRVMLSLLPTPARRSIPAVVVSATPPRTDADEELTPTVVAQVRESNERAAIYSTVDEVETFAGLTATVLVLRDLGTAEPGHYGQAPGASAVLPGPS